ncbi:hypothetical protein M2137_001847 [Parabacteroides sp. PFB2-10]|uniref:DUF3945 domain-containing protein n=1 Tax=Parabacteroides sp. PFB2-10 TaxID=1742405 RepID=UPI002475A381|nr:DUF3945 domain-containing protein [Parabacteroides sp. PFB2-10]MDH6313060.1 hypothetical protein [Parabacteroides sp. PFB2-10]
MDKNLNDQEVLLVVEKDSNELKVVTGLNDDGTPKTVKPEVKNEPDFLKFEKNSDVLENFFSNFMRQAKEPTHFHFFKVPLEKMENMVIGMQELLKNPENPTNKQMLDEQRVMPENFAPKQYQPIDESRINWEQLEGIGVTRDQLVNTNSLDKMLNWQKSPVLFPIQGDINGVHIQTDARLSFRENAEGELSLRVHSVRQQPELDQPLYGTQLTDADKKNLLDTGNAGRLIEFNVGKDRTINAFVSVDKLTNELVILNAEKIKIPDKLKGVDLSEQQKQELREGKGVYIENMVSKNMKPFSATVQVNADKRGLEFHFPDAQKQAQNHSEKIKQGEIPNTFRKVKLSEDLKESLKDGYTVYVSGLKDKKGKDYSGYITLNKEQGKIDFMFPGQYKEALKSGLVIPDSRHKTQVAANSEGKKTEATKKVDEPMKQGQTQPTEKQEAKLTTDKEKLQFVAKYGYEGISNHPKKNEVFNTTFMEKYNLNNDYKNARTIHYNSTFADTVAGTESMLADSKQYSEKMQDTASKELAKQEQKQEQQDEPKKSRGRKM